MYLQIMEQIRRRIAVGDWQPGHELPSIRALAAAIQVSVITVKRAYLELERDGVIVTRQGKGSFVAEQRRPRHAAAARRARRAPRRRPPTSAVSSGLTTGGDRGAAARRSLTAKDETGNDDRARHRARRRRQGLPVLPADGHQLRLEAGQIMGFVGPNGAGKSTTIRILMAMVRQDRGTVRVLGRSMPREQAAAKRDIGFVSEDMRLYGSATLAWHMRFVASIYPGWDAAYADAAAAALQPASRAADQGAVARRARQGHAAARARPSSAPARSSTSRPPASIRSRGTRSSPS